MLSATKIRKELGERCQMTPDVIKNVFNALVVMVESEMKKGEAFKIPGLVRFEPKVMAAREYRNPRTGEMVPASAKKTVKAKVMKSLKDCVNE